MTRLPQPFTERMTKMLGQEAPAFFACYESESLRGLRINPMKIRSEEFEKICPFPVERIPWVENGYYYPAEVHPAQHPYYQAGLYYLQEPSAMTPADRLPLEPGDRVLDLCAAPGGKATQLAGKLFGKRRKSFPDPLDRERTANRDGLLVANEISTSRARALLRNLELFGTPRCFVTNEHAGKLAEAFPQYFDKILVDAPCSGEGMFRRQQEVADAWSPARVEECAKLQRSILKEAVKMLRPGGQMLYSTCTFSLEENEGTIAWFLEHYPEMELLTPEPYEGFAPGLTDAFPGYGLEKCVRIWPHRMGGEGHFLALMRKRDLRSMAVADRPVTADDAVGLTDFPKSGGDSFSEDAGNRSGQTKRSGAYQIKKQDDWNLSGRSVRERQKEEYPRKNRKIKKQERTSSRSRRNTTGDLADSEQAMKQALQQFLTELEIRLPAGRIDCRRERIYLVPELPDTVRRLQFLRNGIFLGEVRKGRFEPAQPFAMCLSAADCAADAVISFDPSDDRLRQYLTGQTIQIQIKTDSPAQGNARMDTMKNGWKLICADTFGIGWARLTGTIVKNKYPASWRFDGAR